MIKTLSIAGLSATIISFSAFAGDGCMGDKTARSHQGMLVPAVMYDSMPGPHQGMFFKTGGYSYGNKSAYKQSGYGESQKAAPSSDIVDTAVAAGSFQTLVKAVQAADLVDTLKGNGPFTVLAPTDEAFAKLPPGTLEALLADKEQLTKVLTYHVVPGKMMSGDLARASSLDTVEGSKVPVDSILVSQADIVASNGVIHVIDEVLIPQS